MSATDAVIILVTATTESTLEADLKPGYVGGNHCALVEGLQHLGHLPPHKQLETLHLLSAQCFELLLKLGLGNEW